MFEVLWFTINLANKIKSGLNFKKCFSKIIKMSDNSVTVVFCGNKFATTYMRLLKLQVSLFPAIYSSVQSSPLSSPLDHPTLPSPRLPFLSHKKSNRETHVNPNKNKTK